MTMKRKKSLRILNLICSPLMHSFKWIKFNVKSQVSVCYFLFKYFFFCIFTLSPNNLQFQKFISFFFKWKKIESMKKVCFRSESVEKRTWQTIGFWLEVVVTEIVYFSFLMSFSDYLSLSTAFVSYIIFMFNFRQSPYGMCICRIFKFFYFYFLMFARSSHVLEQFLRFICVCACNDWNMNHTPPLKLMDIFIDVNTFTQHLIHIIYRDLFHS